MDDNTTEKQDANQPSSKKTVFFLGLLSGVVSGLVLSGTWKPLTKGGVKAGTKGWRKVREVSQKAFEDIQDVVAEAHHELSVEAQQQEKENQ